MDEEKKESEKRSEQKEKKEEQEEAKSESEEAKERFLRLAAEFDNYKKRTSKDLEASRNIGKAELASKLLPIMDEFELALGNLDMNTEHGKGLALVLSNFIDVMKKEGLKEIACEGTYDPYQHEVIMIKESEKKEGTILDVVRKGYIWNGIMLRPASVIVSNGGGEKEETKTKEE